MLKVLQKILTCTVLTQLCFKIDLRGHLKKKLPGARAVSPPEEFNETVIHINEKEVQQDKM